MTDADSLQPNYLTVNPDGTIGADFTGHVKAAGVDLTYGTLFQAASLLDWLSGTLVRALISAGDSGGMDTPNDRLLVALSPSGASGPFIGIEANRPDYPIGNPSPANVLAITPNQSVTIIDDTARSNFLQLLSLQELQLAIGNGTFSWPGANPGSSVVTVNHNIGRVPTAVLLTPGPAPTSDAIAISQVTATTTTSFSAYAYDPAGSPAAGATLPFSWITIG